MRAATGLTAAVALTMVSLFAPIATGDVIPLNLLAAGDTFTSDNGKLVFSEFEIIITGDLNPDLSLYSVNTLDDGFEVVGSFGVADSEVGDILFKYNVTVAEEYPAWYISDAFLGFNGAASGLGAQASITETFFPPNESVPVKDDQQSDAQLTVSATGGGGLKLTDALDFDVLAKSLDAKKDILLEAYTSPTNPVTNPVMANFSYVEQRFSMVPEPVTLLLLAPALIMMARRRRKYQAV